MKRIIIYHGSDKIIKIPEYHYYGSNCHNDYGMGFYCTRDLNIAKEWANRKTMHGFVNKYVFNEEGLKVLDLTDTSKYNVLNWIAILIHNREFSSMDRLVNKEAFLFMKKYYININEYDIVIGFRADDAYFRFPLMFIRNVLTLEKLKEIYVNGKLGKQYVLISNKAFKRIKYLSCLEVDFIYHEKYLRRLDAADNSYKALEILEAKSKGTRIKDLINHD